MDYIIVEGFVKEKFTFPALTIGGKSSSIKKLLSPEEENGQMRSFRQREEDGDRQSPDTD